MSKIHTTQEHNWIPLSEFTRLFESCIQGIRDDSQSIAHRGFAAMALLDEVKVKSIEPRKYKNSFPEDLAHIKAIGTRIRPVSLSTDFYHFPEGTRQTVEGLDHIVVHGIQQAFWAIWNNKRLNQGLKVKAILDLLEQVLAKVS